MTCPFHPVVPNDVLAIRTAWRDEACGRADRAQRQQKNSAPPVALGGLRRQR
jgi:hypothetical protein